MSKKALMIGIVFGLTCFSVLFYHYLIVDTPSMQQQGIDYPDPVQYGNLEITILEQTDNGFRLNLTISNVSMTTDPTYFVIKRNAWVFRAFYDDSARIAEAGYTPDGRRYYIYEDEFYDYIETFITYNFSIRVNQEPVVALGSIELVYFHTEPFYTNPLFLIGFIGLIAIMLVLYSMRNKTITISQPEIHIYPEQSTFAYHKNEVSLLVMFIGIILSVGLVLYALSILL